MRRNSLIPISLALVLALLIAPLSVYAAPPTATSFSTAVPVNAQSVIQLQGNDPDGTSLTFATTSSPSHGALSNLNTATGAVVYTPTAGYTGSDSFTYTVASGGDTSSAATVTLTVTAAKTRIIDTMTNPDGSPRQGKVSFVLTQTASSPSGLIPAKASVTCLLTLAGQCDVSLYPSRTVNPVQWYQVYYFDTNGNSQLLGLLDVPASTTAITFGGHWITDMNLVAQRAFASKAEVDALTQAVAAATISAQLLGASPTDQKLQKYDAATGKLKDSLVSESGSTVSVAGSANVSGNASVTGNASVSGNVTAVGTITAAGYTGIQPSDMPNIDASKIATGTLPNSKTTATANNVPVSIVARDANGDFAARNIVATNLTGNCSACTGISVGTSTGHSAAASVSIVADNDNSGGGSNDAGGVIDLITGSTTRVRVHNNGLAEFFSGVLGVLSDKGGQVYNAVSYGAVAGDGTDDYAAINGAMTAAAATKGTVYLPGGNFRISSPLIVPSGVNIVGAGMNATTLTTTFGVIGKGAVHFENVSDASVSDLTIDQTANASSGISMTTATNCVARRVRVKGNVQWGAFIGANSQRSGVDYFVTEGTTTANRVEINSSSYCFIRNSYLAELTPVSGGNGVEIYQNETTMQYVTRGNEVTNTVIEATVFGGILTAGDEDSNIEGNTFIGMPGGGVSAASAAPAPVGNPYAGQVRVSKNGRLVNNRLIDCGGSIQVAADGWVISGNLVTGNTSGGGLSVSGNYTAISNNRVSEGAQGGWLISGNNNSLRGNYAYNNSTATAGSFHGFTVEGDNNIFRGNFAFDDRATKKQQYGIYVAPTADGTDLGGVGDNNFTGNLADSIYNSGTNTRYVITASASFNVATMGATNGGVVPDTQSADWPTGVSGLAVGDQVDVSYSGPTSRSAKCHLQAMITSTNQITVSWIQVSGTAVDCDGGSGGTYSVVVHKK
jgi:hypothetical protein